MVVSFSKTKLLSTISEAVIECTTNYFQTNFKLRRVLFLVSLKIKSGKVLFNNSLYFHIYFLASVVI